MKINAELILKLRINNSWTQEELAIASGLNLKTIQRIENKATASLQSKKAIASVFNVDIQDLDYKDKTKSSCPECNSEKVFKFKNKIATNPECLPNMLPKLGSGWTKTAEFVPVICGECGYIRYFADEQSRSKLADSEHWELLE